MLYVVNSFQISKEVKVQILNLFICFASKQEKKSEMKYEESDGVCLNRKIKE